MHTYLIGVFRPLPEKNRIQPTERKTDTGEWGERGTGGCQPLEGRWEFSREERLFWQKGVCGQQEGLWPGWAQLKHVLAACLQAAAAPRQLSTLPVSICYLCAQDGHPLLTQIPPGLISTKEEFMDLHCRPSPPPKPRGWGQNLSEGWKHCGI